MCKAHKTLADERSRLYNRTDIYSQDKKAENSRITAVCNICVDVPEFMHLAGFF